MKLISQFKVEIILGLLIIGLFFILRLPNLTLQPIFADEAIYVRWAQVMRAEPTLRFLPLTDGKTPLFMWSMIPFLKVFEDPLFAGRFLSILSGLVTLAGVFGVAWKVFSLRVALWSAAVYAIVPYTVFFDRMALVDSMLAAFSIWSLFFAIWLLKSQRLDLAMILGFFLGGGILVKTPVMINLLVLPLSLVGFNFKASKKNKLLKLLLLWAVAFIIALTMYNLLRLGPGFQQLSSRNADYVFSPVELINRPLDPFIPHLRDIADWFPKLLTWPILVITVIGIIYTLFGLSRGAFLGSSLFVLIWAMVPLILQMGFLKTFTARYLLFSIPPLLIFAGFGLEKLLGRINLYTMPKIILGLALILPFSLYFNYLLLTNPEKAPLPRQERRGYFEDWTAGYGLHEIAGFLLEQKKKGSVVVGTEGYFGTLPDGLMIYLDKADIGVIGGTSSISAGLREAALSNQTYFVANKSRVPQVLSGVKFISEFPKAKPPAGLQDAILLYEVFPDE